MDRIQLQSFSQPALTRSIQALTQAKAQPEGAEASPEDEPEEKAGEGA